MSRVEEGEREEWIRFFFSFFLINENDKILVNLNHLFLEGGSK